MDLTSNHSQRKERAAETSRAVVLFDGVCNLCNASVNFVIDRDPDGYFAFASLQSEIAGEYLDGCAASRENLTSIVLIENGRCYSQSTAALRIARHLTGAWPLLYGAIVIPEPLRDFVYNVIARNRYTWFGKRDSCRLPSPELQSRFLERESRTISPGD